jgi:GntR family transcriptional regulator
MHTKQQSLLDSLRLETSGVPIYVQLREQLLRALGAGVLTPGDRMPTMRQVAVALRIDLNTARRAYDELERVGAIVLERGRGSFVARAPAAPSDEQMAARIDELANQTIATARAAGIDPAAVAERVLNMGQRRA